MNITFPQFIRDLEKSDPELFHLVSKTYDLVMSPVGLDNKTKLLILLAADTMAGSSGVRGIANMCRKNGIKDTEIAETLRIAYMVSINKAIHTGTSAFDIGE